MEINDDENENNKDNENIRYNVGAIKAEYEFYSLLYEQYLKIKENFLISDEDEKKYLEIIFRFYY